MSNGDVNIIKFGKHNDMYNRARFTDLGRNSLLLTATFVTDKLLLQINLFMINHSLLNPFYLYIINI
jgi:hypothetical protein